MRIFTLALKDIQQVLRDRRNLIFLVVMPILFTLFMGLAFRSGGAPQDQRLALGWINADPQGSVSAQLFKNMQTNEGLRVVEYTPDQIDEAFTQVQKGGLAGLAYIPENYSADLMASGKPQLILYADELTTTGQSLFQSIRVSVTRVLGAVQIAKLTTQELVKQNLLPSAAEQDAERRQAFTMASQRWQQTAEEGAGVVLEKTTLLTKNQPFGGNPYNQSSPGILTQFALFGLVASANILVQERKSRTLQRMLTTSMSRAAIIAGHLLANFSLCFAQTLMLVVFGQLVLGVDYLRQPLAVIMVVVALSLWISALGLAISAFVKNEQQVVLFTLICMFVFSALGGTWFPLEASASAFAAFGRLTPAAWAMTGLQNILIRGLDLVSVLPAVSILSAYAVVFFVLAWWRLARGQID